MMKGGNWTIDNSGYPPFAIRDTPIHEDRNDFAARQLWREKWSFANGEPKPIVYKKFNPHEYALISWWNNEDIWVIEYYQNKSKRSDDPWDVEILYSHADDTKIGKGKNKNLPIFQRATWFPYDAS